jgi:hypothetical protein
VGILKVDERACRRAAAPFYKENMEDIDSQGPKLLFIREIVPTWKY